MQKLKADAKPFLKWAGGKGQLIGEYRKLYPRELKTGKIKRYIEPLIGGGAIFYDIANNYHIEEIYVNDVNKDLILTYHVARDRVDELIAGLESVEDTYKGVPEANKQEFYYQVREKFNSESKNMDYQKFHANWIGRAADLIFLNRTCFNGLFRVNSKGEFNVPYGKYKNPKICDRNNLLTVSKLLQNVRISSVDYTKLEDQVDEHTLVYFDPPYRPLSKTSSFTSYSELDFDDDEQKRLADFYRKLNSTGAKLMLSNSDPKNTDEGDNFFEDLYRGFFIHRVKANRMINSKTQGRGEINELLILNYEI